jgi:hypothetical protein
MQRSSTGVCAREILLNQKSRQMDSRFDPHMYTVAVGLVRCIANPNMVMFDIKSMQLKDQNALRHQALVLCPSMRASTAKQPLVQETACLDVTHCNKWLGAHVSAYSAEGLTKQTVSKPCWQGWM